MRKVTLPVLMLALILLLAGCAAISPKGENREEEEKEEEREEEREEYASWMEEVNSALQPLLSDPAQKAPRLTYEIFIGSFCDSDGDGTGDLNGVLSKLDYIHDSLYCDAIWLMPVFPSPTYHKYDVTDYTSVDASYGDIRDLDALIRTCHEKDMKVLLDLPLNHTSTEHPWFREAVSYLTSLPEGENPVEEDCPYVWYYHFSRERYEGYAEIPEGGWFYEARFWEGMPDLAIEHDIVKEEIRNILQFWADRGVDGFRLDAVTSYFTDNDDANIDFLRWLRETACGMDPDTYIVGEAWTAQEQYARYYESGIDSLFDFAFAGREGYIAQAVRGTLNASRFAELLEEEEGLYAAHFSEYVNAPFYTNHDMDRGASYYDNDDGSRIKLAGGLNLMMSGSAFLYYGEELGMAGAGKDENKRGPMYWTSDRDGDGMCSGPAGMDAPAHRFGSLAEQEGDAYSIWNYYRNAAKIRMSFPALSSGKTAAVRELCTDRVAAVRKTAGGETALILINFGEGEETVDLAAQEETQLSAVLSVSDGEIRQDGDRLILPPYGVAVLR